MRLHAGRLFLRMKIGSAKRENETFIGPEVIFCLNPSPASVGRWRWFIRTPSNSCLRARFLFRARPKSYRKAFLRFASASRVLVRRAKVVPDNPRRVKALNDLWISPPAK